MEGTQELEHKYTAIQITQYINIAISVDIITWSQIIKN